MRFSDWSPDVCSSYLTPLATGIPFNWDQTTPVAMLALDEFVLWVNADSPYKTAQEYIDAAKAEPGKFIMAGTGSNQEDQIITVGLAQATGAKFKYIAEKVGSAVAHALVCNPVPYTVNSPTPHASFCRAGETRQHSPFSGERTELTTTVPEDMETSRN